MNYILLSLLLCMLPGVYPDDSVDTSVTQEVAPELEDSSSEGDDISSLASDEISPPPEEEQGDAPSAEGDESVEALLAEGDSSEESGDADLDALLNETSSGEEETDDSLSLEDLEEDAEEDTEEEDEEEAFDKPDTSPGSYSLTDGAEVTLPLFGPVIFGPSPKSVENKTASEIGLTRNTTAQTKKQFSVGAVQLADVVCFVAETGHLDISGTFKVHKSDGTVSIQKYSADEKKLILKLTCTTPFDVYLLPETKTSITELYLTITDSTQKLTAKKSVFSKSKQDTTLNFGIDALKDTLAYAKVTESIPLTTIASDTKGNADLEKVVIQDINISFTNPLFPPIPSSLTDAVAPPTTVTGVALLSPIVLYGKAHLSDSDVTITLSLASIAFSALGQTPINLDDDVTLESPLLEFDKNQGIPMPDLAIGGILKCTMPIIGTVNTPVKGIKRSDGFMISGGLNNHVEFGPVSFTNPEIIIASQRSGAGTDPGDAGAAGASRSTLSVEVQGLFDLFGLKVKPKIGFLRPEGTGVDVGGRIIKRIVKFSAEINDGKPIRPLSFIPGINEIPGIEDFIVNKAQLGVDSAKNTFIGGTTTIMNIATQAKIITSGGRGLMFSSLQAWKPSDSIPQLAGTVFDSIAFEAINFGFTAKQYLDNETGMLIEKGANIFGTVDLNQGIFEPLRKMIGSALPKKLIASLILNPNPMMCKVQLAVPLDIKISSKASLHKIIFEVSGAPGIALMTTLKLTIDSSQPPLLLTARIEFNPLFFAVSGTLQGTWKSPFGVPGLEVSNVALEIQQPYAPLPPVGFGLTGQVALGDFLAMVAVKLSPTSVLLIAEISKWPLFALPSLLKVIGLDLGPLDILKAIDIALYDVKFKFAPVGGQIGTIMFDAGISASGTLIIDIPSIIKAKLEAGFNIGLMSGFKLYAQMPAFNIGPLRITGKGKDREWNTPDDGPIMYAEFSLAQQRIFISALAELFGSSSEIEIDIGLLHLRFKMILKLLGLLDAHIVGETYHKGYRIGFRAVGKAALGPTTELVLAGDINTLGCSFSGSLKSLTLKDLAGLCHIPTAAIPNIGLEDVEFYIRAQG